MIQLRRFQRADLERLYEIDQACFPLGIAYSKAELRYYLQHPKACTSVAVNDDSAILGFCIGHTYLHEDMPRGHIITIDVVQEARRHGVGRMLLEAVEEHFRSQAVGSIKLEVAVDNLNAQNFYTRMGYEVTGRIPGYYMGSLDAFVMTKQISESQRQQL